MSGRWQHGTSTPELVVALWPVLEAKIERCKVDAAAQLPEIVQVVLKSYHLTQRWRYLSFVLREEAGSART